LRSTVKSSQVTISVPFSHKAVMVKISSFSTDIGCLFHGMSFHHNAYFTLLLTKKLQLLGDFVPDPFQGSAPGPRWVATVNITKYTIENYWIKKEKKKETHTNRALLCPPTMETDGRVWPQCPIASDANARGVCKFWRISDNISETVYTREAELQWTTNRKLYGLSNGTNTNDLEWPWRLLLSWLKPF